MRLQWTNFAHKVAWVINYEVWCKNTMWPENILYRRPIIVPKLCVKSDSVTKLMWSMNQSVLCLYTMCKCDTVMHHSLPLPLMPQFNSKYVWKWTTRGSTNRIWWKQDEITISIHHLPLFLTDKSKPMKSNRLLRSNRFVIFTSFIYLAALPLIEQHQQQNWCLFIIIWKLNKFKYRWINVLQSTTRKSQTTQPQSCLSHTQKW